MQAKAHFSKEDIFQKLPVPTALRKMIGAFEERAAVLYVPAGSGISSSSAHSAA